MNPSSVHEAGRLARSIDGIADVIIPPACFLDRVAAEIQASDLGAQDMFVSIDKKDAGHTGGISGKMIRSLGASWVIVGHSELRASGDTDAIVRAKFAEANALGLKIVLCVGEPKAVRKSGMLSVERFIRKQVADAFGKLKPKNVTIAYEPIWAIGSGKADAPESAGQVAELIIKTVKKISPKTKCAVLYGGSVMPGNVKMFAHVEAISGFLVGGSSLDPKKLKSIRAAVTN